MGVRNAIDLLNAEQAYSLTLRDYKYALYDNFIRVFQLKSAAGILSDADIAEVSKKASPTLSSQLKFSRDINPN
jgi:outer membrane protein TolC